MKIRITIGAAMLLSLGSALAGGLIYTKERSSTSNEVKLPMSISAEEIELTPELIAKWKATAATAEYSPAMLPI